MSSINNQYISKPKKPKFNMQNLHNLSKIQEQMPNENVDEETTQELNYSDNPKQKESDNI